MNGQTVADTMNEPFKQNPEGVTRVLPDVMAQQIEAGHQQMSQDEHLGQIQRSALHLAQAIIKAGYADLYDSAHWLVMMIKNETPPQWWGDYKLSSGATAQAVEFRCDRITLNIDGQKIDFDRLTGKSTTGLSLDACELPRIRPRVCWDCLKPTGAYVKVIQFKKVKVVQYLAACNDHIDALKKLPEAEVRRDFELEEIAPDGRRWCLHKDEPPPPPPTEIKRGQRCDYWCQEQAVKCAVDYRFHQYACEAHSGLLAAHMKSNTPILTLPVTEEPCPTT